MAPSHILKKYSRDIKARETLSSQYVYGGEGGEGGVEVGDSIM